MQHKHFLFALALALVCMPTLLSAQSTEGKDFWVTLMRSDSNNPTELSLTFATKNTTTKISVKNTVTGYDTTFQMAPKSLQKLVLNKKDCYVGDGENKVVSDKALHVTADHEISLIAANYRDKSFDVAAILPTPALGKEYRIQCYSPSAHEDASQGSHFAVIATEDNTVVRYVLSLMSDSVRNIKAKIDGGYVVTPEEQAYYDAHKDGGDTLQSPVMQKGQVFYYWTGNGSGDDYDLTGTAVFSDKPVAVFNGNPHTNIPLKIRDRDHIYSQAMPTMYWGTQFAITSSLTTREDNTGFFERIDKIRVQALEDGTTIKINGALVHTFDFVNGGADDQKHFYEFEFGKAPHAATDPLRPGLLRIAESSCFIEVSCPCAVHQFMVSDRYDWPEFKENGSTDKKYCNGDPSLLWVNPIEEQIEDITFGTFQTAQVKDHFLNIVTATGNVSSMTLDGESISANFAPLNGNPAYSYARMSITNATHNLHGAAGFIANVYGFGEKESYAYPAGGKTVPLESSITINGKVFTSTSKETLCALDTIKFALALNYDVKQVVWGFGDGTTTVGTLIQDGDTVRSKIDHFYKPGDYNAFVLIDRESSNLCKGQTAHDSIPIHVTIGKLQFTVDSIVDKVCEAGEVQIYFTNTGSSITGKEATISFNDFAKASGFQPSDLKVEPNRFRITVPSDAKEGPGYGVKISLHTECGDDSVETAFTVPFDPKKLIVQRWNNVMGVRADSAKSMGVVAYQWYKDGVKMEDETASVLNLHNDTADFTSLYHVCMTLAGGEMQCTCGMTFQPKSNDEVQMAIDTLVVKNYQGRAGQALYVVTDEAGTAELYTVSGSAVATYNLPEQGGYVTLPRESGFYVMKVQYGKRKYSAKVYVY